MIFLQGKRFFRKGKQEVSMAPQVLVNNSAKYRGMYVATRSFKDKDVVVSGSDMVKVYNEAQKQGIAEPVISYVPKKNASHK